MSTTQQTAPLNLPAKKPRRPSRSPARPRETEPGSSGMVRLTVSLPADLVDHLRNAVYWTPNLTLAWLIAQSLRTSLTEMESSRREPFPKRTKALRAGRPRLLGQSMEIRLRNGLKTDGTPRLAENATRATLGSRPYIE